MSTTTPPTTSARQSLWLDADRPAPAYPPPDLERSFDVVVLGGGIVGLTTAVLLKRAGARVAVVEAARTGSGVTGHSTAKVTALQSTMLTRIARTRGKEAAQEYARLNATAVEWVATTGSSSPPTYRCGTAAGTSHGCRRTARTASPPGWLANLPGR